MQLVDKHWEFFKSAAVKPQGAVGRVPSTFAANLPGAPKDLPKKKLTRDDLLAFLDRTSDLAAAYLAIMAWGAQHSEHKRGAWQHRQEIVSRIERLCARKWKRAEAYELLRGIEHLGPAYFTKILHFLSPDDMVIMDQWTARSVNLLIRPKIVALNYNKATNRAWVTPENDGATYDKFCAAVELIGHQLRAETGTPWSLSATEARLFCLGGRRKGPWRSYVLEQSRP